jgi:hypothetical protein
VLLVASVLVLIAGLLLMLNHAVSGRARAWRKIRPAFVEMVLRSTDGHPSHGPAAATLEQAVAVIALPAAPPRHRNEPEPRPLVTA